MQENIQDNIFGAAMVKFLQKVYLTKLNLLVFGKKTKKQVKFAPPPPPPKTTKKAGDKIVQMLSKTKPPLQRKWGNPK